MPFSHPQLQNIDSEIWPRNGAGNHNTDPNLLLKELTLFVTALGVTGLKEFSRTLVTVVKKKLGVGSRI